MKPFNDDNDERDELQNKLAASGKSEKATGHMRARLAGVNVDELVNNPAIKVITKIVPKSELIH